MVNVGLKLRRSNVQGTFHYEEERTRGIHDGQFRAVTSIVSPNNPSVGLAAMPVPIGTPKD